MLFNVILFFLGFLISFWTIYSYYTYIDNKELKKEIERIKDLRKDFIDE